MNKLLLLLFFTGCSFFVKQLDAPLIDSELYKKKLPVINTYCPLEQKVDFQLVGTNPYAQGLYKDLLNHPSLKDLDFFDHFALWSLIQISIRPDQSSMTSRLQALFLYQGKTHYYDFFSDKTGLQYPYFYGIEWVLKKFGKKTTLEFYAALIERFLQQGLRADSSLESFLLTNQEIIKKDPVLTSHFFRGNEVLKENETVPRMNYMDLIKHYRKVQSEQSITINTSLTPFDVQNVQGECNYDFNLYENSIFLIDKITPVANIFGISLNKNSFLASSAQAIGELKSILGQPLLLGESKVRSSAFCTTSDGDRAVWTVSTASRDPGQHLFHLFKYGLASTKSTFEVDKLIRHSRHLFLSDPVRLIIESNRSTPAQIESLLKLNLPIYNADKLGNIWAFTHFPDHDRFIVDDRNTGVYTCK